MILFKFMFLTKYPHIIGLIYVHANQVIERKLKISSIDKPVFISWSINNL